MYQNLTHPSPKGTAQLASNMKRTLIDWAAKALPRPRDYQRDSDHAAAWQVDHGMTRGGHWNSGAPSDRTSSQRHWPASPNPHGSPPQYCPDGPRHSRPPHYPPQTSSDPSIGPSYSDVSRGRAGQSVADHRPSSQGNAGPSGYGQGYGAAAQRHHPAHSYDQGFSRGPPDTQSLIDFPQLAGRQSNSQYPPSQSDHQVASYPPSQRWVHSQVDPSPHTARAQHMQSPGPFPFQPGAVTGNAPVPMPADINQYVQWINMLTTHMLKARFRQ